MVLGSSDHLMQSLKLDRSARVRYRSWSPLSSGCKIHVGLGTTTRRDIKYEGAAMFRVGALGVVRRAPPGRCDEQAREISSNERGTAGLPRRHPQAAQMLALRIVDVDAAP